MADNITTAEEMLLKHVNEDDLNFIFHHKFYLYEEILNAIKESLPYCDCNFVIIMRDEDSGKPYCSECKKEIKDN